MGQNYLCTKVLEVDEHRVLLVLVKVTVTVMVVVTDNLLRYSSYRKAPRYLDSYLNLFRAPLHEVLPTPLTPRNGVRRNPRYGFPIIRNYRSEDGA